jgi:SAM-dependent methyltransferase
MLTRDDWTVGYFDEPYTQLFPFPGDERSDAEVEALAQLLPPPPARVLDVACGPGRHAVRLAERGFEVTGIDTSSDFLASARDAAADRGASVEFLERDMRDLDYDSAFDAALNVFTAWGYFDEATNQRVLDRIARALCPGGRFVIDVMNRDWLMRAFVDKDWTELADGTFAVAQRAFDPVEGVIAVTHRWRSSTGELRERHHRVRIHTATDLDRMLRHAGLAPVAWYGGFTLEPLGVGSRRLLVVSERSS